MSSTAMFAKGSIITGPIKAGSDSRLNVFEECKQRAHIAFVQHVKEPDRGPPPRGQKEWANDRGSRIHDKAEEYVRGKLAKLIPELKDFKEQFEALRAAFKAGNAQAEEMWCYDRDWVVCGDREWNKIAFRIKIDAFVHTGPTTATVIDYKTGRKDGNEVKHAGQTKNYAIGAFLKFPDLQTIITELWYTDQDYITQHTYTRANAMYFFEDLKRRQDKMTSCVAFPPNPNIYTCKWCPFNGNACEVGYKD